MTSINILVPDIGDLKNAPIAEVLVSAGDRIEKEQTLVSVESDKALIDVPSPVAGTVQELVVKIGDRVSEGSLLLRLSVAAGEVQITDGASEDLSVARPSAEKLQESIAGATFKPPTAQPAAAAGGNTTAASPGSRVYAGPAIRRFAREVGIDLERVAASGPRNRITRADVNQYIMQCVGSSAPAGGGLGLIPWPNVDHAAFGPIEMRPLSRVQKASAKHLHRNWVTIPHVTNHDYVDITALEELRAELNQEQRDKHARVSMLAFVMKACAAALQSFPELNASLVEDSLVLKSYYNIGFATDTPEGLLVPVVRHVEKKNVRAVAHEISELADKARTGRLKPDDLKGGTFSISSLGGIGGRFFTPIINAPEVAILGLGRAELQVGWVGDRANGSAIAQRMLPLSLSWDHRALDGALAARFLTHVGILLNDFRRVSVG